MHEYAARIARYTAVGLFLWFGFAQILNPGMWLSFLPTWTGYFPIPGEMLVQWNGWFEITAAFALLLGVYTRPVALVLGVHLLLIGLSVSGATAVRDIALGLFVISVGVQKADVWTVDHVLAQKTS